MKLKMDGMARNSELKNSEIKEISDRYDELEEVGNDYVEKAQQVEKILEYIDGNPAIDIETRTKYLEILKKQRADMNVQYIQGVELQREILDKQMNEMIAENVSQSDENKKIASELNNILSDNVNLDGVSEAQKEATENAEENDAIAEKIREEVSLRQQFAQMQARKMRLDGLK